MAGARLVHAAASPYVMVKHGRREDRAAAYDRFIAACAAAYYDGNVDRDAVTEMLASLQAVELRAPKHVRNAANDLFDRITAVDQSLGFTRGGRWLTGAGQSYVSLDVDEVAETDGRGPLGAQPQADPPWWKRIFQRRADPPAWRGQITNADSLLLALGDFTNTARMDVIERWWHNLFIFPSLKRWWLRRK